MTETVPPPASRPSARPALRERIGAANAWVEAHPPPGPFRPGFWRSPIRGTWLTSVLGALLLVGIPIVALTGFVSFLAYNPWLPGNDGRHGTGVLTFIPFHWPSSPSWGYRVTQGTHVTLGVALIPILLVKLWSVIPKLFEWPGVRSPAHALERLSLFLLVGGAIFTFVTGVLNVQYWYTFPGSFYTLHFYGAWVFMAAFLTHAVLKVPIMVRAIRERRIRDELKVDLAHTVPEPYVEHGLVSATPTDPTISRRGALGLTAAASASMVVVMGGQTIGGPLRRISVLSPRGGFTPGQGANDFQVNISAAEAKVAPESVTNEWRLQLSAGGKVVSFSRAELLAMPLVTSHLPIACVEGWSVPPQRWEGIRLRDLARMAGLAEPFSVYAESLQTNGGAFGRGRLAGNQIRNGGSLLALKVNGENLSMDHGFPARIIVPNNPGVRNTKWVHKLTFEASAAEARGEA